MQGKNFLFERSNLNTRTPTMLFEKWQLEQVEGSNNSSANFLSKFNLPRKQLFAENLSDSFHTPRVEKIPISTPPAPVKHKKKSKKGELKPKKLQYTDDEFDDSNIIDSGVHIPFDQLSDAYFCKQHTPKCTRFDSSQKQVHRLRAKLGRIRVQANDKENDKNVIRNTSVNVSNKKSNVIQESSVVFNPNNEVLSQCDSGSNWKEILYWLQPRRDVGLWVECCRKKCKKFRYVEEYHDPVDVPKIWYCEMNSDKVFASCDVPEQPIPKAIQSDLIENAYNAGSIVWAHIKGFPWWPAIVNDCPDTYAYYQLPKDSLVPSKYYVTFFNEENLESAWVTKRNIKPFVAHKYGELIKRTMDVYAFLGNLNVQKSTEYMQREKRYHTKFHGIDYKDLLKKAHNTATKALSMSILERLEKFSFVAQYDYIYCDNNNNDSQMDVNSDNEIPCSDSVKGRFTLKEYYLQVLCKKSRTQKSPSSSPSEVMVECLKE